MRSTSGYSSILMHILPPVTAEGFDGSHQPRFAECYPARQHAQSVQADMKQTFSLILNFSACKRTILHRDSVSLMTKWILSHNNPCFQCYIAITNFLVSHTCEISFHDLIGQSTVPMYSSA